MRVYSVINLNHNAKLMILSQKSHLKTPGTGRVTRCSGGQDGEHGELREETGERGTDERASTIFLFVASWQIGKGFVPVQDNWTLLVVERAVTWPGSEVQPFALLRNPEFVTFPPEGALGSSVTSSFRGDPLVDVFKCVEFTVRGIFAKILTSPQSAFYVERRNQV